MNANEAKKLTLENLKGPVIAPYLEVVYQRIRAEAVIGHNKLFHPFYGLRMPFPSMDAVSEIYAELRKQGYKVTEHPDPDPGHPASAPYTTIEW